MNGNYESGFKDSISNEKKIENHTLKTRLNERLGTCMDSLLYNMGGQFFCWMILQTRITMFIHHFLFVLL